MSHCSKGLGILLALLIGSLSLSGCSQSLDGLSALPPQEAGTYGVAAGDKLHITVQDIDSAAGDYIVDESGALSLPLIKDVTVQGLGFRQIEDAIETAYKTEGILTHPVVTVQPAALRPFYVLGEVNRPGEFEYRQGMTVLAAVSAAGGYTYRARTGEVAITRTIDGRQVTSRASEDDYIQPGDRIKVIERWF